MHGWLEQANLLVLIIPEGAKLEAAALKKPVEVERA